MGNIRLYFATDIHGSEICFLKFLNAAKFYKADVLILGGDITGKIIVPVIEQSNNTYESNFLGRDYILKNENEVKELEKKIRFAGLYPYRTTVQEVKEMSSSKKKVDAIFSRLMMESIQRWISIADQRLKQTNVKCYITPGNDDRFVIDKILNGSSVVINPEGKVVTMDNNYEIISTGYSNITPWKSPREVGENKLSKKILNMCSKVGKMESCIFNLHCPPYNSTLDLAPELDDDLRPIVTMGEQVMIPVGSKAVREAILKHQPMLGLHGHIHESRGVTKISRTLCINPGSEYTEGILRGAIVNIEKGKIKSHILVSG